jgi:hypothetical protein
LREFGDCSHLEDEGYIEEMDLELNGRGRRLLKGGLRRYVRVRILSERLRRRKGESHSKDSRLSIGVEAPAYCPTAFRLQSPSPREDQFASLITLEIPDFELWINELWHDFLTEPTPYLVASAILYLGFILILVQYHTAMWQIACFFMRFIPWDDEFEFG